MERETKEIVIDNISFVVKTYLTAREQQAIQSVYYAGSKIEVQGESYKINEFNPGVKFEVEKEMINQLVVSINSKKEDIVESALNLKSDIYADLIKNLDEISGSKKK